MSGLQLLEWLKSHSEFDDVLVVVVSGLNDLASIRRAYSLGADSFLTKPCGLLDLQNLMQWFSDYWQCSAQSSSDVSLESVSMK
jgi:CheY-like chemotaxis protein